MLSTPPLIVTVEPTIGDEVTNSRMCETMQPDVDVRTLTKENAVPDHSPALVLKTVQRHHAPTTLIPTLLSVKAVPDKGC